MEENGDVINVGVEGDVGEVWGEEVGGDKGM